MASIGAVSIANDALALLGAARIGSLEESTESAQRISAIFDNVREEVLASHPWACALKRAVLARSATDPAWEWSYMYPLPGDCLRPWALKEETAGYGGYLWVQEGNYILTDAETCSLIYTYNMTNYPKMLPGLRIAISVLLAYRLAYLFTNARTMAEQLWNYYQKALMDAQANDAQIGHFPGQFLRAGDVPMNYEAAKPWERER